MIPKIKPLPPELVNKIAAGEIIERPASVVKEIIENAIDANATDIHIDIEEAGTKLIRIRDNGIGIEPEDIPLAFTTHATSKIFSFDDLEHVMTLGFRGEALASIASVSKTTLISHAKEAEHAWKISPYISMDISPVAHTQGTTIEVRDLFYNVPARKKFLKSERTERQHIVQLIERLALSKPGLHLTLTQRGKIIGKYGGETHKQSIISVMGEEMLEQSIFVEAKNTGMSIHGWVGLPTYSHLSTDKQHFFINGRIIRDKLIAHAIKQAYQDVLYHGRHPIFVLFLNIDPELIDVNAHPTKHEVRFREARLTHDFIFSCLNHNLRGVRPSSIINANPYYTEHHSSSPTQESGKTRYQSQLASPLFSTDVKKNIDNIQANHSYFQWVKQSNERINAQKQGASIPTITQIHTDLDTYPLGYALGQIHNIFILAENNQGLVIVDMHAAHERILYERFKENLHKQNRMQTQQLLIPTSWQITAIQEDLLEKHHDWLCRLGFYWKITNDVLTLTAIPSLLKNYDISQIFCDVIKELEEFSASHTIERLHDIVLSTLSCHRAVRAHDVLSISEMNQLLRDIENTPSAGQCNHGRPTWIQLDEKELGLLFMRGQ